MPLHPANFKFIIYSFIKYKTFFSYRFKHALNVAPLICIHLGVHLFPLKLSVILTSKSAFVSTNTIITLCTLTVIIVVATCQLYVNYALTLSYLIHLYTIHNIAWAVHCFMIPFSLELFFLSTLMVCT